MTYTIIRQIGNQYYKYRQTKDKGKTISEYLGKATKQEFDQYKKRTKR